MLKKTTPNAYANRLIYGLAGLATIGFLPDGEAAADNQQQKKERPNILFIMADDHTSQAWGCYGSRLADYAPTQNIDRLRSQGALLQNCFVTNSISVPSRASILTGQYGHLNGAKTLQGRLDPERDNLAKRLQQAGYQTALVGKWHLKSQPAGFDYYNVLHGQGRYHDPILYEKGTNWEGDGKEYEGHSVDVITSQALKWLKKQEKKEDPYCMMLHFKSIHEPFYGPERYQWLYKGETLPEPLDLLWDESPKNKVFKGWPLEILMNRFLERPKRYAPPPLQLNTEDPDKKRQATYQKFIKDYLRGVAGIDESIGRVMEYLEKTGQAENTVVIYTSDQGYFLGEHNMFDKRFMLEESARMPFIIRYPKEIDPGTTVDDIILNIDFPELLLDYARTDIPDYMQGRSFRENLKGNTPDNWRDAMYYHYWTHQERRPSHYGIRTDRYKLIYYYGLQRMGHKPDACWELYDLKKDPQELANVYNKPEYKKVIEQLKKKLEALRQQYNDTSDPLKSDIQAKIPHYNTNPDPVYSEK